MSTVRRALKRAESLLQRELIRVASAPSRVRPRVVDLRHPRRVLMVRHDWIGDMIMSTGVLRRIKEAHPEADVDVIAGPSNAQVLDGLPFVRRVFVHRQGHVRDLPALRRELRPLAYDAALNGRVLRPKLTPDTALLLLLSGAARRVGVAGGGADFVYTDPVRVPSGAHFVRHVAALTQPLGLDPDVGDWRPTLHVAAEERDAAERLWAAAGPAGDHLLVNLSAREADRRWPDEHFAEALRQLNTTTPAVRVLVLALPAEFARAKAIADAVGGAAVPPGGLRQAFALTATADAVLTPDTGIAHAASAFATPTVVLMQPGKERYLPYRTPGRYVMASGPTVVTIPAGAVAAALQFVLSSRGRLEPECLPFSAPTPAAPAART